MPLRIHGLRRLAPRWRTLPWSRGLSSPPPPPLPASRLERVLARLPPRLRNAASGLRGAPLSHVAAFLILHEATAVVPLVGLAALFHYCVDADRLPIGFLVDWAAPHVRTGIARFERYFRRKGWFGFEPGPAATVTADENGKDNAAFVRQRWDAGSHGYRIVVEVALAYAVTKILLPVRILASVWATPWLARRLVRWAGLWTGKR